MGGEIVREKNTRSFHPGRLSNNNKKIVLHHQGDKWVVFVRAIRATEEIIIFFFEQDLFGPKKIFCPIPYWKESVGGFSI